MQYKSLMMAIIVLIIAGTSCQKGVDDKNPDDPSNTDTSELTLSKMIYIIGTEKDSVMFDYKDGKLFRIIISGNFTYPDADSILYDDKGQIVSYINNHEEEIDGEPFFKVIRNKVLYKNNSISIIRTQDDLTLDTTEFILSNGKIIKQTDKHTDHSNNIDYFYNNSGQVIKRSEVERKDERVFKYSTDYTNPFSTIGNQLFWATLERGLLERGEQKLPIEITYKEQYTTYKESVTITKTINGSLPTKTTFQTNRENELPSYDIEFIYTQKQ